MPTSAVLNVGSEKYPLKHGESYVIGLKSDDCAHDIEIDDASIDVRHCVLDFTEPIPRIFDVKSKSGTFVDSERIPSCFMFPVKKSTSIRIGNVDANLQLVGEGDSGFLEERLSPPIKDNFAEEDDIDRLVLNVNPTIATCVTEHNFLVPTATVQTFGRSIGETTNESLDSFNIPETQAPCRDELPPDEDDDDSFYIPETQDVATAMLNNYPRVAFEDDDVNEIIADCDKIPSSQFRICTQDFNGSEDGLSNHSDDILANVPSSLVIPAIRHSPVQIDENPPTKDNSEVEKELSRLQWSRTSEQTTHNASTPDNVHPAENLDVPDHSSQCSTPDIFADHEPVVEDMERSLKENEPPAIVADIEPTQVFQKPFAKKDSGTPNKKNSFSAENYPLPPTQLFVAPPAIVDDNEPTQVFHKPFAKKDLGSPNNKKSISGLNAENSPLPPTQLFVAPPLKPKKHEEAKTPKQAIVNDDDDLPPTQVFQPAPANLIPSNLFLSSTLVDSGAQQSESSFKAKCNKLLDSDDDEMDEIVAPDLVQKYREAMETAKDLKNTLPTVPEDDCVTPPQRSVTLSKENSNLSKENGKMLPPKNIPLQTPKTTPAANAHKQKSDGHDGKYVDIEDFLFTPDFLGREFAKDENLQKKAELNWKNQRKSLFRHEEIPTKPENNESDESQDSFIDLIPNKKKLDPIESVPSTDLIKRKDSSVEVLARITRRRQSSKEPETTEKTLLQIKSNSECKMEDVKTERKQIRTKRQATKRSEKTVPNEELPTEEKSKDSLDSEREDRQKQREKRKTRKKSISPPEDKLSKQLSSTDGSKSRLDEHSMSSADKPSVSEVSLDSNKSSTSYEEKVHLHPKWTEKRILEIVLNKKVAKKNEVTRDDGNDTRSKTRSGASRQSKESVNTSHDEKSGIAQKLAENTDSKSRSGANTSTESSAQNVSGKRRHPKKATPKPTPEAPSINKSSDENVASLRKLPERGESKHRSEASRSSKAPIDTSLDDHVAVTRRPPEKTSVRNRSNASKARKMPVDSSSDERVPRRVSENAVLNASIEQKKLVSSREEKTKIENRTESETVGKKQSERGKKRVAANKIEEEEEVPQKRVTRLRSARQTESTPTMDQSSEPKQVKSSRQTRGRVKPEKDNEKGKPKQETVDLTESDVEAQSKAQPTPHSAKRKHVEVEPESKPSKLVTSESAQPLHRKTKVKLIIAMTMCDPRYQEVLEKHSGNLWVYTKDPKECDVLIVEKGNRTYKLMVAIARGVPVVKLDWLIEVLKRKTVAVPMEEYIFQDPQFQERHQFLMKKSLFLAKTTSLFKGMNFMMTPNIRPSPSEMKDIITCAGGTVLEQAPKHKQRLYLVSHTNDNQYWHQYRRSNSGVKIITTEGVMASVMQQSEGPLKKSIIQ